MQETWVPSPGREDSLEKEMPIHSSILVWKTPGQRGLTGYSPWGRKRDGCNLTTKLSPPPYLPKSLHRGSCGSLGKLSEAEKRIPSSWNLRGTYAACPQDGIICGSRLTDTCLDKHCWNSSSEADMRSHRTAATTGLHPRAGKPWWSVSTSFRNADIYLPVISAGLFFHVSTLGYLER